MKSHRLLTFRRSPLLTAVCLAILALVFVPLALAAVTADSFAGGTGAASLSVAGLMGAPLFLRDKADEHGGGGGGSAPDVAAALEAVQDVTMPMSQRLNVAMKALQGIDPTNQLAAIKTQLDEAKQNLSTRETELANLQAELDKANARIAALETDATEAQAATAKAEARVKELEATEKDLSKRADAMAKERMRELGFKAADLPPANSDLPPDVPATKAELEKAIEGKTIQESRALLAAYKKAQASLN